MYLVVFFFLIEKQLRPMSFQMIIVIQATEYFIRTAFTFRLVGAGLGAYERGRLDGFGFS